MQLLNCPSPIVKCEDGFQSHTNSKIWAQIVVTSSDPRRSAHLATSGGGLA